MTNNTGSETITDGIKVQVFPDYLPEQSTPELNRFSFSYKVLITNEGDKWAKLISRRWTIIDSDGDTEEVEGPGVVGYTPEFSPGESFEYTSVCPLDTSWGTMEGIYHMIREDGTMFEVKVGRFYLVSAEVLA